MNDKYVVYMLLCRDGSLYTGMTNDIEKRVRAHNSGCGARYTAGRRPVELVYLEDAGSRSDALKREAAVKKLPRTEKLRLVEKYEQEKKS